MTTTDPGGALAPAAPRDNGRLLTMLEQVADEGWDGPTGRRLLVYVREHLARPLAFGAGLRGLAAGQAEASAWQAAWEVLALQDLRAADQPWGVVWRAAQRAVAGEVFAARYGADPWNALRLARTGVPQLVGLDILIEFGLDASGEEPAVVAMPLQQAYDEAIVALREVGWPAGLATRIIAAVADLPDPGTNERGWATAGWRTMASTLGLPPWQARRLCVALLGTVTWPGLLARMVHDGVSARRTQAMQDVLRCTRVRRRRSPVLTATRADDEYSLHYPQLAAG
jgi:hypothetical protein